jgi:fused signal recognition particle receptor
MFSFIKDTLSKIYTSVTSKVHALFSREIIDQETLNELEQILIQADTGVKTTKKILAALQEKVRTGQIAKGSDLQVALEEELLALLTQKSIEHAPTSLSLELRRASPIYLLVGINGSGKTTFAGKLAHLYRSQGKRVLLVAADTFRAAATEQLTEWARRTGADILTGQGNQDPAAVVFQGCEKFKKENYDILIIDTAGRLQTKVNLMRELEKIKRVIAKQLPDTPERSRRISTLLTIDAMLGQNSFEQARLFHESTQLNGIVLTKIDGTGKGGIVFAITQELGIPIAYLSFGEKVDALKSFNAPEFIRGLMRL